MMGPAVQISEEDAERQAEAILRFVPLPLPLPYVAHVSFAPSSSVLPSVSVGTVAQHNSRHNLADAATMTEQVGSPTTTDVRTSSRDNNGGLLNEHSSTTISSTSTRAVGVASNNAQQQQQLPLRRNSAPDHAMADQPHVLDHHRHHPHVADMMQSIDNGLHRVMTQVDNVAMAHHHAVDVVTLSEVAASMSTNLATAASVVADAGGLVTNHDDHDEHSVHVMNVFEHQDAMMDANETWSVAPGSPTSFSGSNLTDEESDADAELFAPSLQEAQPVTSYPTNSRRSGSATPSTSRTVEAVAGPTDTLYISDDSTAGSSSSDECEIIMVGRTGNYAESVHNFSLSQTLFLFCLFN